MNAELIEKLHYLADKYETAEFLEKDPAQFMHTYDDIKDVEVSAFIAANLAFGRRDQILSHVSAILEQSRIKDGKLSGWVLSGNYRDFFINGKKSFYRMYSHDDMILFFDTLKMMMEKSGTIGEFVKTLWQEKKNSGDFLHQVIAENFPDGCALVPKTKNSAAKKLNMLLRWLVRDNSPVDLGIWTWFEKKALLMPLDTHVLRQSVNFGLLEKGKNGSMPSGNLKTVLKLTESMKIAFDDDPVRGDFALFGLGVAEAAGKNNSSFD